MIPRDLIVVGHILGAYGLNGHIKVKPYSIDAHALLYVTTWWLQQKEIHPFQIMRSKYMTNNVIAKLHGITTRNIAETFKGTLVQISQKQLPILSQNEFYLIDLINLSVITVNGKYLGKIYGLMESPAHPILRITILNKSTHNTYMSNNEILIPFIKKFVTEVLISEKKIIVDWENSEL